MTVPAVLFDSAGRRRSPATMPGYHAGRPPRNKGMSYAADPPSVQEIIAVMRQAGAGRHGARLRGLIVVLWRSGYASKRHSASVNATLTRNAGSLVVRHGKGGRRREIGMDAWGWEQLRPWLTARLELPVGPMFCVIDGPNAAGHGQAQRYAASFAASPSGPGCGAGSRRTNCATRMRSNSLAKEFR